MVVISIMIVLTLLLAPAFTNMKSAGDITSAAYTVKGVLDQARTHAMANNTYTWVGFAGSIGANTSPTITGQVSIAIVASNDGTKSVCAVNPGDSTRSPTDSTTPSAMVVGNGTAAVTQLGKLAKIDNAHIGDTGVPAPNGTEFESRAAVNVNYRIGAAGSSYNTDHPFTVQQTTFNRWIQFSPRGEAVVKGGTTQIAQYAEVGLLPTRGTTLLAPNIAAIQISGFGGNVRIYRR